MKQFSCIGSSKEPRLRILLNSGAFDDLREPSKSPDQQQDVQRLLNAWVEDNEDCRVFKHPKPRGALKHDTNRYEIPAPPPSLTFATIPSEERATLVVDRDGCVLAYKFRIPDDLHQKLVESSLFLSQAKRANYSLWATSTEEIAMSLDYRKHLPESENFFEYNRELWNVLDDVLRLLDPVMYRKYTNVDQFLKEDEKRLAGAWHGAIVNRQTGSKEEAVPRKNWKDWSKGLTAMIPWGDYEGGDVKLYNLGLMFEMKPCDVLLVNARCVSYGVQEVTRGVRNELVLVVAATTIKWRHEKATNGASKRVEERKRMERERKKAQKQRTSLGRTAVGGSRSEANQIRPPTERPPTSTTSNAMPLGTRSTEGQEAMKVEKRSRSKCAGTSNNKCQHATTAYSG